MIPFYELIGIALMIVGVFFILIAGVGVLRMPDLFLRMSTATKASTLGLGLILLGTAVYFWEVGIASRAMATIVFVLLTAPVSAHMIGRAAYSDGVPLWSKTIIDELEPYYDQTQTPPSTTETEDEPPSTIIP